MKRKIILIIISALLAAVMCEPAFGASRALSYGSTGDDVYMLQQALWEYGYLYSEPTGYFGDATENAVMSFQYDHGLYADGIAGEVTLGYMGLYSNDYAQWDDSISDSYDDYWNDDSSLSRPLSKGCAGNDVALLQSLLAEEGFFHDVPSGFFGDYTEAAVIDFQYACGLYPDGIAGSATISELTGYYSGYEEENAYYYDYSPILAAIDSTPAAASGYCATWVTNVLRNAGVHNINPSYDANDYWANVCYSTDPDELQPGMVIAVRYSKSYLGQIYGHVGFYLGDGLVISSVGYKETLTLEEWISRYNNYSMGSYPAWGYVY